jgi:hypothetical protein
MRCPVVSDHQMIEIADGLFQCPKCGAGPLLYWALSEVEVTSISADAQCVTYREDLGAYTLAYMHWEAVKGRRIADSLSSVFLGLVASSEDKRRTPLPYIALTPRKLPLKKGMFSSPLGEKTYGQKSERTSTSEGGPSPAGSGEHSPTRRRRLKK